MKLWTKVAVTALCLCSFAGAVTAQDAGKTIRVGVLLSGSSTQWSPFGDALVEGLRERGLVEGRNLVIVPRYGELSRERIRDSAAEMAAMQLDAIVTSCTATTQAAASAAPKTPIIMATMGDPVGAGLIASLARPGGNVTGRASLSVEFIPKRLELLRAILPQGARKAARVGVLMNPKDSGHRAQWEGALAGAKVLDLELVRIEAIGTAGIEAALDALPYANLKGLYVFADDPSMIENRAQIAAGALRARLPTISAPRAFAAAGGLMSYGMDIADDFRLSASYVVKVVQGTKAADLPVELPTRYELTVNLRTAAELGIRMPREVMLLANGTIQ